MPSGRSTGPYLRRRVTKETEQCSRDLGRWHHQVHYTPSAPAQSPVPTPRPEPSPPSPAPPVVTPAPTPQLGDPVGSPNQVPPGPADQRLDGFYWAWDRLYKSPSVPNAVKTEQMSLDFDAAGRPSHDQRCNEDGVVVIQENAVTSYEQAAAACRTKVDAIVKEAKRLNRRYTDRTFSLLSRDSFEGLCPAEPPDSVHNVHGIGDAKRIGDIFDRPVFISKTPQSHNVVQGTRLGDCWFISGVTSLFGAPELLDKLCVARDEKVGVYGFVFYRDGEWISEIVDDFLAIKHGDAKPQHLMTFASSEAVVKASVREGVDVESTPLDKDWREQLRKGWKALYFAACQDSQETWLPLIEKAYAKAHGDYDALEAGNSGEAIEDLTGGVCCKLQCDSILDLDQLWTEFKEVNKTYLFGVNSGRNLSPAYTENNVVNSHCYSILEAHEAGEHRVLKLRNPWASEEWKGAWSDGSKEWTPERMKQLNHTFGDDGIFWMSFNDLLTTFRSIDRTRLFGPEWTVSQQWTTVLVDPSNGYLKTHFKMEVSKAGPHVVVLSQPDRRFFQGFEGRYFFQLHFRVYKDGEDTFLCRSMSSSNSDIRSCNVEMDLEPGVYRIHVKVTAFRLESALTPREVIQKLRKHHKAKLIAVGKRFDMVASKGKLREFEEAYIERMCQLSYNNSIDGLRHRHEQHVDRRKRRTLNARRKEEAKIRKADEKRRRRYQLHLSLRQERLERLGSMAGEKCTSAEKSDPKKDDAHKNCSQEPNEAAGGNSKTPQGPSAAADPAQQTSRTVENDARSSSRDKSELVDQPTSDNPQNQTRNSTESHPDEPQDPSSRSSSGPEPILTPTTSPSRGRSTTHGTQTSEPRSASTLATTQTPQSSIADHHQHQPPPSHPHRTGHPHALYDEFPVSEPSDVHDSDFSWDSAIDKPTARELDSGSDECDSDDEVCGKDPWRAALVLGLRVYSLVGDGGGPGRGQAAGGAEQCGDGGETGTPSGGRGRDDAKETDEEQAQELGGTDGKAEGPEEEVQDDAVKGSRDDAKPAGVVLSVVGDGGLDEYFNGDDSDDSSSTDDERG